MIVATAGHIDHGKTALVKALTGIDADRLPEEKKRGITVDLGFAYTRGAEGQSLGFVDVPGHEKLVRTMLAGATGVDFVILVIAADDGIMPQTREHLAILDLLGIRRGVVAITKIDRVEPHRLHSVAAEARALITGSVLREAPIIAVSAHRGDGIGDLLALLETAAIETRARDGAGRFRLAIDRAFTMTGAGLVVTGTVHAGRVAPGDRLLLLPQGREIRVRGLRTQNEVAETGAAGQRCALNISGPRVEKADIARGDWIVAPDLPAPTTRADVHLRLLPSEARPLRHWTPVHVHIGSADIIGRIALLEASALAPGGTMLAQLVLDQPTSALYGDRFVLRDQSAQRTLGGGHIVDPLPPRRHARKPARLAFLAAFDHADSSVALDALLASTPDGIDLDHFAEVRNLDAAGLRSLVEARDAIEIRLAKATLLVTSAQWAALRNAVIGALETYQATHPDSFGATVLDVLRSTSPTRRPMMAAALDALIADKAVVRFGQLVHLPGHAVTLTLEEENLWYDIRGALAGAALDPPRIAMIADTIKMAEADLKPLLEKIARMGRLRRVSKGYFVLPEVAARLATAAQGCAATHEERLLTVGQFREATGISRHATMPILEFFDRIGFTSRHRDGRRIKVAAETIFTDE